MGREDARERAACARQVERGASNPTLAQVAALTVGPEYNAHFVRLYKIFILQLREVVPPTTHLPAAYDAGGDEEQAFVQNLALFFTAFFRARCAHGALAAFRQGFVRMQAAVAWQC
jgi:hypothetical protein